ncbi:predicted protein [Pyrenophora tritici-repentis Pt-1C-BFP]|uniref:Uncharacterized protein n=1 Tax=Pyrenophora tritici-repentis (strain Pt-1C-BFP) TaxID=426418 RepID=B2W9L9_PYRTR|nr:uncharacterized protein PTRG_06677 [Pyrenophora tritici-repentis Pt-1C-BFP]EDU49597.1 predicted protein [Pyrenophora tritici-repentis Pt-1C-BFP]
MPIVDGVSNKCNLNPRRINRPLTFNLPFKQHPEPPREPPHHTYLLTAPTLRHRRRRY